MKKEKVVKIKPSLNQLQKIKFICEAMEIITGIVSKPLLDDDLKEIENRYWSICEVVSELEQKVGG